MDTWLKTYKVIMMPIYTSQCKRYDKSPLANISFKVESSWSSSHTQKTSGWLLYKSFQAMKFLFKAYLCISSSCQNQLLDINQWLDDMVI